LNRKLVLLLNRNGLLNLLGYDFTIEYKKGRDNFVADALSRKMEEVEESHKPGSA
jgi:hypothetical protein